MSATAASTRNEGTPILDRREALPEPAPRRAFRDFLLSLLRCLVLGIALGIIRELMLRFLGGRELEAQVGARISHAFDGSWTGGRCVETALTASLAFVLCMLVHEFGHVLGGWLAGFRFTQLRVGLLHIDRPFCLSLRPMPPGGAFGQTMMSPLRCDRLVGRAAVYIAAGPLLNLLSILVVLLLLPGPMGLLTGVFVVVSLALGVGQLAPMRSGRIVTDGHALWLCLRHPSWIRRWIANMRLVDEVRRGVSPEDCPGDWVAQAVGHVDDSVDTIIGHMFALAVALVHRRDAEAAGLLEVCLRRAHRAPPRLRDGLRAEAAEFCARRWHDPELAEGWLREISSDAGAGRPRSRAEAAVLQARGDVPGALEKLANVEHSCLAMPDTELRRMMLRSLAEWRAELSPGRDEALADLPV